MESYNDFFLLYFRNLLNSESLKLDKDKNMINHLDIMKQLIVHALNLYSNYEYTKKYLTPEVKKMINYIKDKNEMQKLKSKRKLLSLKNGGGKKKKQRKSLKNGVGKNKKKKKKQRKSLKKKKRCSRKASGTGEEFLNINSNQENDSNQKNDSNISPINNIDELEDVRTERTVFGNNLEIEKYFNRNKFNKMSRKLNKLTQKSDGKCKKCLEIDFLAGIIDEQNKFVCSDLVGNRNFLQTCANKISTASEAHISQCDEECKFTTKGKKKINYREYIKQSLNYNLISPELDTVIEDYFIVSLIPDYIEQLNSKMQQHKTTLLHQFGEERPLGELDEERQLGQSEEERVLLATEASNSLHKKYLNELKEVRTIQINKLREIARRIIKDTVVENSIAWKNKKDIMIRKDVTEYTVILDQIRDNWVKIVTWGIVPITCAAFYIINPGENLHVLMELCFYIISIIHTFALIINNSIKGTKLTTFFYPIVKMVLLILPFLGTFLIIVGQNPEWSFLGRGGGLMDGGGSWLTGALEGVKTMGSRVVGTVLEGGMSIAINTFLRTLMAINDVYVQEAMTWVLPLLPKIVTIMCIAWVVLDRFPEFIGINRKKTLLRDETKKKVKASYIENTNWYQKINNGFEQDGDLNTRNATQHLVAQGAQIARRTDLMFRKADLAAQNKQAEAAKMGAEAAMMGAEAATTTASATQQLANIAQAQANAQAQTAIAQLETANATRRMANATSRATELQAQAQAQAQAQEVPAAVPAQIVDEAGPYTSLDLSLINGIASAPRHPMPVLKYSKSNKKSQRVPVSIK
jgi:hypothetical protein